MRRKAAQPAEPVIAADLLEQARKSVQVDTIVRQAKCTVCSSECSPASDPEEQLCWVCRRLKISAWRDSDQQMPAQE